MKTIGQRCEFVTSDYREKVLQALDFRNRFAERPFVCQSLIQDDQIMVIWLIHFTHKHDKAMLAYVTFCII